MIGIGISFSISPVVAVAARVQVKRLGHKATTLTSSGSISIVSASPINTYTIDRNNQDTD